MLAPKCATYNGRSTFANPKYLKKAQSEKPRLYEIPYDTSDPANRFCPNGEETVTLEKESRSKLDKDKVKPYDYTYQNSLYETFKPPSKTYLDQLERAKEVRKTMWRKTFNRTKPNIAKNVSFLPISKSISKSRQLYNEMTNNFNHFRTICQQTWSNHTNSAFPNPTAKKMHDDLEYVKSLEKEVDELESEKADFSNIYDLLLEECVSKDVTCSYLHSLSDLNANTELQCLYLHKVKECECLAQKLSKQTESRNVEITLAVFNYLTFVMLVLPRYVWKELIARTKKPLYSALLVLSKTHREANKSVATPLKKTVASDNTIQGNLRVTLRSCMRIQIRLPWNGRKLRVSNRYQNFIGSICPNFHRPLILLQIVQLILFIVDSGCTKHMTGNLKLLCNFVEKFLGTVRFGNDQFAPILGYGDLIQGNVTIKRVYYVEGLNHNLFSVGQFCDADLEVAFRKSTCFVRDLQGNDLLTGNRGTDLYTISLQETTSSTPICFMAKASPTQAWLWHRRLSHLNFDYITLLSKKDIVTGLPKLKYVKDQLCSSCEMSKAKISSFKLKDVPSSKGRLNLLHMDLCGPMRVASINGKNYILVIVDDYSRYSWTLFLRSKDETPEVLKDFLTMIQRNLQAQVISVRTDRGTEFLNKTLHAYFKEEGIEH
ncbi:retrovirus-related pol polyprotein from transposon TNT 1-94 [Tanacetum coccineum]